MATKGSAMRYSQAVFEIARERQEFDRWQADLEKIAVVSQHVALVDLLENPRLRFEDKSKLVTGVLGDISPLALNLAHLLVVRGKVSLAAEIAVHYQQMLDAYRGIGRADVITAIPLDDSDKLRLEARLGAIVDKKVVVKQEVDANLLGGVVARMGGKLLDGSVRSKLAALKKEIGSIPR